jgi:hypothetical protein
MFFSFVRGVERSRMKSSCHAKETGGQGVRRAVPNQQASIVLFVLGGVWELLTVRVGLIPVVCIVAGVLLLLSVLLGKPQNSQDSKS